MSANLPALYTVASTPRLGEGDARAACGPICRACKQAEPRAGEDQPLVLPLDRYAGEPLVSVGRGWAVSAALARAFEAAGLRGYQLREIPDLPSGLLLQLVITGRAQAASSWWRRMRDCPTCHRPIWRMTTNTTRALFAAVRGEIAMPRSVYRERWQGDDLFYLDDPGPPIVTAATKAVLEGLAIPGLVLHPARFVRDRRLWV